MIAENFKEPPIRLELSQEELCTILQFCKFHYPQIHSKIEYSTDGIIYLFDYEADALLADICETMFEIEKENEKVASILYRVAHRIPISSSTTEAIKYLVDSSPTELDSQEKINNHVEKVLSNTPDPSIGNLTQIQLRKLQHAQWGEPDCPVQFNRNLSLEEVNSSIFFRNTRLFLKTLSECSNEITATDKGNLSRAFIKRIFETLELSDEDRFIITKYNKVINETDIFPLHIIKIICELAKIISLKSKKFLIVKKYENIISDEKAGELYYLLFYTYFREFNIGYMDRLPKLENMQGTFDYTLFRLSRICNEYQTIEKLFAEIFLPKIKEEISQAQTNYRTIEEIIDCRIIRHLEKFGLLEVIRKEEKKYIKKIEKVRKSELFDKFMKWEM